MRFLLLHDGQSRGSDTIRSFFTDIYEAFVKVYRSTTKSVVLLTSRLCVCVCVCVCSVQAELNPFYVPNTPITSSNFRRKAQQISRKYL